MNNAASVRTFDKFAIDYDRKYRHFQPYTKTYDKLAGMLSPTGSWSVLDIACGPGHISRYLLNKGFDLEVVGFDLAPNMIDLARKNIPGGDFSIMDCRNMAKLQRRFDIVICGFCVPYLNQAECTRLINDVSGVLRPGGIVYLSAVEGSQYYSECKTSRSGDAVQLHHHPVDSLLENFSNSDLEIEHVTRKQVSTDGSSEASEVFLFAKSASLKRC